MSVLAAPYRPRRPAETTLHHVVSRYLKAFITHAAESYDAPLPKYVKNELRRYLRCGLFQYGFLRARCETCKHDLLVAFSCKGRGICPSCSGRRMSNTAAHLVDRVFPSVPVRQWVLSLPFDLRAAAAFDAKVLTTLVRAFAGALAGRYRAHGRAAGLGAVEFAAVTFVQRFGSSLNLNVHLHVVVADGVFSRDAKRRVQFTATPTPTAAEMCAVIRHVQTTLVKRPSMPQTATDGNTPIASCARIALSRGDIESTADAFEDPTEEKAPHRDGAAVEESGFNVEASVRIAAEDDFGREHLLRYCARPALSLSRLTERNGRIAYRIKKLRGGRAKARMMTPLELLARLAALIPPPRYPLVRFHGAFAPRSSWRRDVVPQSLAAPKHKPHPEKRDSTPAPKRTKPASHPPALVPRTELLTPNVLTATHWERLKNGALVASTPRVDWPRLMRRTFEVDVLECPKCFGRIRILSIIEDLSVAHAILSELHVLPPPAPQCRDPTELHTPAADSLDPC